MHLYRTMYLETKSDCKSIVELYLAKSNASFWYNSKLSEFETLLWGRIGKKT